MSEEVGSKTKQLASIFTSKTFKKTLFVFGLLFFILTLVISLDPKPFLRFGYVGVFVFNLIGPGTLLVPSLSRYMNVYLLALATALGMAGNDSVSWLVGRNSDVVVARSKGTQRIEATLHKYGPYALFVWSLIPFPYDLIGFIAGYLEFPYRRFIIPTILGKFVRFILLGLGIVAVWGKS